jgi:hypothetical protein
MKIVRMDDSQYRYDVDLLMNIGRALLKRGFLTPEKKKAVADIENMVSARLGYPWRAIVDVSPPVEIKPDPEEIERQWQEALARQRALFADKVNDSGPEEGEIREDLPLVPGEAFVQLIKGSAEDKCDAVLYVSADRVRTMIHLSIGLMCGKFSSAFLKEVRNEVFKLEYPDRTFQTNVLNTIQQAVNMKRDAEIKFERRFDTFRVTSLPKRIYYNRRTGKRMGKVLTIEFSDIPKITTLNKVLKFMKIFRDPEPKTPLEEEALALLKARGLELEREKKFPHLRKKKKKVDP